MGLETGNYIADLNTANPVSNDPKSQGDDHLRLIKTSLKNALAGFPGHVLVTGSEAAGATANDYVLTITPAPSAYTTSSLILFKATHTNTGAVTLKVNSLAALDLKSVSGAALVANDIVTDGWYVAVYNGTNCRLISITKNYVDQLAFSAALPAQISDGINRVLNSLNGVASWGASSGTGVETRTASATLTSSSKAVQVLNMSAYGQTIKMADATTLTLGHNIVTMDNSRGQYPAGILDGLDKVLGQVLPGDVVTFHLTGQADAGGTWRHSGNLDPWFIDAETVLDLATYNGTVSWIPLDTSRAFIYYKTVTNNYPAVRLVTLNGAGVAPTISNELVVKAAVTDIDTSVVNLVGSSNRVLLYLTDLSVVCVDISTAATITGGASAALTWTSGTLQKITYLDSRYLIARAGAGSQYRAKCIDCGASGTSVTVGAEANSTAAAASVQQYYDKRIGTTAVGVFGTFNNGVYHEAYLMTVTRTAGTTLSWSANAGNPTGYRTDNTNQIFTYFDIAADKILLPFHRNGDLGSYVVVTFAASSVPTFGSVANSNVAAASLTFSTVGSPNRSNYVGYVNGSTTAKNIENVTVSGSTITVGAATSVTADATIRAAAALTAGIDDNGRGFVSWKSARYGGSGGVDKYRVFTTAANVFTFSTEVNGTSNGAVNGRTNAGGISDLQGACGSGVFSMNANTYNTTTQQYSAVMRYFKVNSDRTINTLAELDINHSNLAISQYANTTSGVFTGAVRASPGSDPVAQNLVVFGAGGYKSGRTTYISGSSPNNALLAPNARTLPIILVNPDTRFGRNASLYKYRFAEV